jgi:hypothetical protein
MHLQGLILALRFASGRDELPLIRRLWFDVAGAVCFGTGPLIRNYLVTHTDGTSEAERTQYYMYLPGDVTGAIASSPSVLLAEMAKCDRTLFRQDGSSILSNLPDPSLYRQWTCTAATYAEALRLMVHISKRFPAAESRPQQQGELPGCAVGTGTRAMACIPCLYVCCVLFCSLWYS